MNAISAYGMDGKALQRLLMEDAAKFSDSDESLEATAGAHAYFQIVRVFKKLRSLETGIDGY